MSTAAPRFAVARLALLLLIASTAPVLVQSERGPFESLEPVQTPAGEGSLAPQLAVSPDGHVWLSWLEPAAAPGVMRFRLAVRQAGAWTIRTDISQGAGLFANWADVPSVFAAKDGRLAAHWLEKTASSTYAYGVRVRTSRDGGASWTDTVTPHRDASPTEHGFLSFFDAPGGEIGMVWLDGRQTASPGGTAGGHGHGDGAMSLRATTLSASGALGADVLVDDRVCDCCPTAAIATARGVLAAFRDRSATEVRDIGLARFEGGAWKAAGVVHADGWEIPGCPVNGPSLASDGHRVAIGWFTAARDQGMVQVAFSADAGATFGRPVRIDDGNPIGRVDTEWLPDGSSIALWVESAAGRAEIRARRVFADGRRGPSAVVAAVASDRSSGHPRIVRLGDELFFAWRTPAPHTIAMARAAVPADARR